MDSYIPSSVLKGRRSILQQQQPQPQQDQMIHPFDPTPVIPVISVPSKSTSSSSFCPHAQPLSQPPLYNKDENQHSTITRSVLSVNARPGRSTNNYHHAEVAEGFDQPNSEDEADEREYQAYKLNRKLKKQQKKEKREQKAKEKAEGKLEKKTAAAALKKKKRVLKKKKEEGGKEKDEEEEEEEGHESNVMTTGGNQCQKNSGSQEGRRRFGSSSSPYQSAGGRARSRVAKLFLRKTRRASRVSSSNSINQQEEIRLLDQRGGGKGERGQDLDQDPHRLHRVERDPAPPLDAPVPFSVSISLSPSSSPPLHVSMPSALSSSLPASSSLPLTTATTRTGTVISSPNKKTTGSYWGRVWKKIKLSTSSASSTSSRKLKTSGPPPLFLTASSLQE